MCDMSNEIRLDVGSNPAFSSMFSGKKPGDECEITICFVLKDATPETVRGSITKVYDEDAGEEEEGETGGEASATSEEPIMVAVIKRGSKKS